MSRTALGTPVVFSGLYPHEATLNRQQQSVAAQINQVFGSFQDAYAQARSTYYSSIQNQANPSQATTSAFVLYTTEQVSLLSQQVLNVFVQGKHTAAQANGLKRLIGAKIMGARGQTPPGSLAFSLLQTIPQPGTTAPTSSLYSLSEDSAIQAARVAILNGANQL